MDAFARAGLTDVLVESIRGLAAPYGGALRRVREQSPTIYEEFLALVEESARRPEVIGMAWHAVAIGRKP